MELRAGTGRAAVVQSLQPFDLDERTGHPTLTDPRSDWLEASIGAFLLTGLPDLPGGFTFTGRDELCQVATALDRATAATRETVSALAGASRSRQSPSSPPRNRQVSQRPSFMRHARAFSK